MRNAASATFDNLAQAAVPYDSFWAIEASRGFLLWQSAKATDFKLHAREFESAPLTAEQVYFSQFAKEAQASKATVTTEEKPPKPYRMDGDVAIIQATGPLTKNPSSWSGGTSTLYLRRMMELAAADADVKTIVLRCDSPGGSVSGTGDCADALRAAAAKKTVLVSVEDLCASAMYWISSGATKIYCNPSGMVGSIGTYMTICDMSRAAKNEGYEVFVIGAGEMKGAGTPGTEITPEQREYFQTQVDDYNQHFLGGIAAGRKMDAAKVKSLNNGRCYIAQKALDMGLIDGIKTFSEVLEMAKAPDVDPETDDTSGLDDDSAASKKAADGNSTTIKNEEGTQVSQMLDKARALLGLGARATEQPVQNLSEESKAAAELIEDAARKDLADAKAHAEREIAARDAELAAIKTKLEAAQSAKSQAEEAAKTAADKAAEDEHAFSVDQLIEEFKLAPSGREQAIELRKANAEMFDNLFALADPIEALAEVAPTKEAKSSSRSIDASKAADRIAKAKPRSAAPAPATTGKVKGGALDTSKAKNPITNLDLHTAAQEYAEEHKCSYTEALRMVASDNPDLIEY